MSAARAARRAVRPAVIRRRVVAMLQRHMRGGAVPTRAALSKAFATAQTQAEDQGWLKPGTLELTARGRAEEARRKSDPRAAYKDAVYEWVLAVVRADPAAMAKEASAARAAPRRARHRPDNRKMAA